MNCHCRYCRRAHGAAFVTVSWVRRAGLRFLSGADALREHGNAEGVRCFCGICGTRLFNAAASIPDFVSLVVASLDEAPARGPVMHINVESKASWYEILDGLPQHQALPPAARRALEGSE